MSRHVAALLLLASAHSFAADADPKAIDVISPKTCQSANARLSKCSFAARDVAVPAIASTRVLYSSLIRSSVEGTCTSAFPLNISICLDEKCEPRYSLSALSKDSAKIAYEARRAPPALKLSDAHPKWTALATFDDTCRSQLEIEFHRREVTNESEALLLAKSVVKDYEEALNARQAFAELAELRGAFTLVWQLAELINSKNNNALEAKAGDLRDASRLLDKLSQSKSLELSSDERQQLKALGQALSESAGNEPTANTLAALLNKEERALIERLLQKRPNVEADLAAHKAWSNKTAALCLESRRMREQLADLISVEKWNALSAALAACER